MLNFNNTSEIEPLEGILGQERAIEAMEKGLKINNPAYNIYLSEIQVQVKQHML